MLLSITFPRYFCALLGPSEVTLPGHLGDSVVELLPLAQGVIPGTLDRVLHQTLCGACFSLCLGFKKIIKKLKNRIDPGLARLTGILVSKAFPSALPLLQQQQGFLSLQASGWLRGVALAHISKLAPRRLPLRGIHGVCLEDPAVAASCSPPTPCCTAAAPDPAQGGSPGPGGVRPGREQTPGPAGWSWCCSWGSRRPGQQGAFQLATSCHS